MTKSFMPLEQIKVASPCHASWDDMSGDDRARFCGQCGKHVYNLSNMSRSEADALVSQTEGRMCVRFYRRADGTVLTQDCPVGWRAARRRMLMLTAAAAAILIAFLGVVTSITAAVGVGWANGWRPRPLVWLVNLVNPVPMRAMAVPQNLIELPVLGEMCPPQVPPNVQDAPIEPRQAIEARPE